MAKKKGSTPPNAEREVLERLTLIAAFLLDSGKLKDEDLDGAVNAAFQVLPQHVSDGAGRRWKRIAPVQQYFIVESCDSDEGQVFEDTVPAKDEDEARDLLEAVREYATVCNVWTPAEYRASLQSRLKAEIEAGPSTSKAEWANLLESNNKKQCAHCGKIFDEDDCCDGPGCDDDTPLTKKQLRSMDLNLKKQ
jgi:hypothetical protein